MSTSADVVYSPQNTPCELTLPWPHFGRGLLLQFGERSVFRPQSHPTSNQISKAPNIHPVSGGLKGIIAKRVPSRMEFFSLKTLLASGRFHGHTLSGVCLIHLGNELCFDPIVIVQAIKFPKLQIIKRSQDIRGGLLQNDYLRGWGFFLSKHSLRVDASMATLWERSASSIRGTKCVSTPESSYKQSNFQSFK